MSVTSPFGDVAIETIEHLNEHHDDSVALIAKALANVGEVRFAQISCVDHDGVAFDVITADGATASPRITFAERVDSADAAAMQFYALLAAARAKSADTELTSIERELAAGTISTWVTQVTGVVDVTPRMRQITVSGGLDDFQPLAPDQFVYVLAPPPGRSELTIGTDFSWEDYESMPEEERPVGAYYTVRRWDPDTKSLDLWVVLHGHGGHGEQWAANATVGAPVALWGPRQAYEPPVGTNHYVLLADETALPAIAAILESLTPTDRACVVVALGFSGHAMPLVSEADVDVHWVIDDGSANPLLTAIQELAGEVTPTTYLWGGAESRRISAIRRYVRDTLGLGREYVSLTGYWRADSPAG